MHSVKYSKQMHKILGQYGQCHQALRVYEGKVTIIVQILTVSLGWRYPHISKTMKRSPGNVTNISFYGTKSGNP